MRLAMVGVDHRTANVDVREIFSFDSAGAEALLSGLLARAEVAGCALLVTCNRTELYLSHAGDPAPDGVALLCEALEVDAAVYRKYFTERHERLAATHLMRVAGGLLSSVRGDDQIVTQVRNAIETARGVESADSLLETLFRHAVTAGKRIKTSVRFAREGGSVAAEAVAAIEKRMGSVRGRRALVIGNGVIGRLTAAALLAKGCAVAVTLRTHRPDKPGLPEGCEPVPYDRRYQALRGCDIVVSATSSPHLTLRRDEFRASLPGVVPPLLVDLAIPRDIDPAFGTEDGATLLNVDDVKKPGAAADDGRQLAEAEEIIGEEAERFEDWRWKRRLHAPGKGGCPDFPLFVNLRGAVALIAGAGKVAARRAEVLLGFGARVRLVAPALSPEMKRLIGSEGLVWEERDYAAEDLDGATLAVAATSDREVNRRLGLDARKRGILTSVADRREECTFFFPAIVRSESLTAGLVSNNGDHVLVRKAAAAMRGELERIDEDHSRGKPGKPSGCGANESGGGRDTAPSS